MTVRTRIDVLASGGDAQEMSATVCAVVRGAIQASAEVLVIQEG